MVLSILSQFKQKVSQRFNKKKLLEDMVIRLSEELEICLEHRMLYRPDPEEFDLVKEARALVNRQQKGITP